MKKIGFFTLLIMATLLFTLAFPAAAAGPKPPVAPIPAVAAAPVAPAVAPVPERHPHIDEALESMRAPPSIIGSPQSMISTVTG